MTYIDKTAIVENNTKIGKNVKVWHFTHVMNTAEIGDDCTIGQNCFIGENVKIGKNVKIQNNVSIYDGVVIEDDVFIGPSVVFTNVKFPRSNSPVNKDYDKTVIKRGVSIGANSTIVCGIIIHENSFIGAGSVVTKDLDPNGLYFGNPARFVKKIED